MMDRIRPNVLFLIGALLTIAIVSIVLLGAIELAMACVTGMVGIANKIVE